MDAEYQPTMSELERLREENKSSPREKTAFGLVVVTLVGLSLLASYYIPVGDEKRTRQTEKSNYIMQKYDLDRNGVLDSAETFKLIKDYSIF